MSVSQHETWSCGFNVQKCRTWLKQCQNHHLLCPRGSQSRLPSRILDVSPGVDKSYITLHVSHPDEMAAYLALSYRWGGPQHVTLTSSTLEAAHKGVQVDTLPQTLKDAVQVTRELGIRYLWVDALCIMQDSAEDKMTEISRMHHYYQNATVAIQPTGLLSVQDGFLERYTNAPNAAATPPTNSLVASEEQCTRLFRIPYFTLSDAEDSIILEKDPIMYEPWNEPLNRRAWVLQERLLGRQALIFPSTGGLVWQCQAGEKVDGRVYVSKSANEGRERLMRPTLSTPPQLTEINASWRAIVVNYSGRDMTDPGDKLIAIGAIAEHYYQYYGSKLGAYCAGLWYNSLVTDLCWYVEDSLRKRPELDRAPTWSWASVEGQLSLSYTDLAFQNSDSLVEVLSC